MEHPRSVVLVRHGQTDRNRACRIGRFLASEEDRRSIDPVPDHEVCLSKAGRRQAAKIGRMLRDEWGFKRFDAYFDSGYRRSIETLDLILRALPTRERRQADRCSHLDLRERDTGYPFLMTACEGDTFFPWWREYEEMVGPIYSRPPGGESIADAWQRVHMFLNSMRRSRAGDDVLIVTHGRIMLGFKYWMERHPACDVNRLYKERSRIRNCEAWWYRYDIDARRYVHIRRLVPPGVWAKK